MAIFLEKINAAPLNNEEFSFQMNSWISVLVDTLNEILVQIEEGLNRFDNGLVAPSFTTAEITALAVSATNGTLWYDTTTNQLKAKVNNVVVVIA